jgi:hypothetical protein
MPDLLAEFAWSLIEGHFGGDKGPDVEQVASPRHGIPPHTAVLNHDRAVSISQSLKLSNWGVGAEIIAAPRSW